MSDAGQVAESRCLCGRVKLQFMRPKPVLHVHCCCNSCRQGREWLASQGGPPMTKGPTLVYYFENDLAQLKPRALSLLFAIKLRESGRTTRLVTKCCHSAIAMDHPFYEENVLCVHANTCNLIATRIEPLRRLFSTDWNVAYDGEMPPATAALGDSEGLREKFSGIIKRPIRGRAGVKLQDILAQLPPVTNLGLPENSRI
jgi:hypothetical protein